MAENEPVEENNREEASTISVNPTDNDSQQKDQLFENEKGGDGKSESSGTSSPSDLKKLLYELSSSNEALRIADQASALNRRARHERDLYLRVREITNKIEEKDETESAKIANPNARERRRRAKESKYSNPASSPSSSEEICDGNFAKFHDFHTNTSMYKKSESFQKEENLSNSIDRDSYRKPGFEVDSRETFVPRQYASGSKFCMPTSDNRPMNFPPRKFGGYRNQIRGRVTLQNLSSESECDRNSENEGGKITFQLQCGQIKPFTVSKVTSNSEEGEERNESQNYSKKLGKNEYQIESQQSPSNSNSTISSDRRCKFEQDDGENSISRFSGEETLKNFKYLRAMLISRENNFPDIRSPSICDSFSMEGGNFAGEIDVTEKIEIPKLDFPMEEEILSSSRRNQNYTEKSMISEKSIKRVASTEMVEFHESESYLKTTDYSLDSSVISVTNSNHLRLKNVSQSFSKIPRKVGDHFCVSSCRDSRESARKETLDTVLEVFGQTSLSARADLNVQPEEAYKNSSRMNENTFKRKLELKPLKKRGKKFPEFARKSSSTVCECSGNSTGRILPDNNFSRENIGDSKESFVQRETELPFSKNNFQKCRSVDSELMQSEKSVNTQETNLEKSLMKDCSPKRHDEKLKISTKPDFLDSKLENSVGSFISQKEQLENYSSLKKEETFVIKNEKNVSFSADSDSGKSSTVFDVDKREREQENSLSNFSFQKERPKSLRSLKNREISHIKSILDSSRNSNSPRDEKTIAKKGEMQSKDYSRTKFKNSFSSIGSPRDQMQSMNSQKNAAIANSEQKRFLGLSRDFNSPRIRKIVAKEGEKESKGYSKAKSESSFSNIGSPRDPLRFLSSPKKEKRLSDKEKYNPGLSRDFNSPRNRKIFTKDDELESKDCSKKKFDGSSPKFEPREDPSRHSTKNEEISNIKEKNTFDPSKNSGSSIERYIDRSLDSDLENDQLKPMKPLKNEKTFIIESKNVADSSEHLKTEKQVAELIAENSSNDSKKNYQNVKSEGSFSYTEFRKIQLEDLISSLTNHESLDTNMDEASNESKDSRKTVTKKRQLEEINECPKRRLEDSFYLKKRSFEVEKEDKLSGCTTEKPFQSICQLTASPNDFKDRLKRLSLSKNEQISVTPSEHDAERFLGSSTLPRRFQRDTKRGDSDNDNSENILSGKNSDEKCGIHQTEVREIEKSDQKFEVPMEISSDKEEKGEEFRKTFRRKLDPKREEMIFSLENISCNEEGNNRFLSPNSIMSENRQKMFGKTLGSEESEKYGKIGIDTNICHSSISQGDNTVGTEIMKEVKLNREKVSKNNNSKFVRESKAGNSEYTRVDFFEILEERGNIELKKRNFQEMQGFSIETKPRTKNANPAHVETLRFEETAKTVRSESSVDAYNKTQEIDGKLKISSSTSRLSRNCDTVKRRSQDRFPFTITESQTLLTNFQPDVTESLFKCGRRDPSEDKEHKVIRHPSITRLAICGFEETPRDILSYAEECECVEDKQLITRMRGFVQKVSSKWKKTNVKVKQSESTEILFQNQKYHVDTKNDSESDEFWNLNFSANNLKNFEYYTKKNRNSGKQSICNKKENLFGDSNNPNNVTMVSEKNLNVGKTTSVFFQNDSSKNYKSNITNGKRSMEMTSSRTSTGKSLKPKQNSENITLALSRVRERDDLWVRNFDSDNENLVDKLTTDDPFSSFIAYEKNQDSKNGEEVKDKQIISKTSREAKTLQNKKEEGKTEDTCEGNQSTGCFCLKLCALFSSATLVPGTPINRSSLRQKSNRRKRKPIAPSEMKKG